MCVCVCVCVCVYLISYTSAACYTATTRGEWCWTTAQAGELSTR